MKKILVCSYQYSQGGIPRVVHALEESLINIGCSVDTMAPTNSGRYVAFPIPSLNLPGLPGSLSFWELGTRMSRKMADYDLVMMHHPAFISSKPISFGDNVVVIYHGTYCGYVESMHLHDMKIGETYSSVACSLERKLLRNLSKSKAKVTGVSPGTITELYANGYNREAYFVPNAMPRVQLSNLNTRKAREVLNREFNLNIRPDDKLLLFVGSKTNSSAKRLPLSISFFKCMAKKNPNMKFISLGGTVEKQNSEDIINLGYVAHEKLPVLYASADAYIALSCHEGLPNAALEAAAYGLPQILSDIPAHRYILSEKIGHGILVDSIDPLRDLAKAESMLQNSVGERYYPDLSIMKKFSWDAIAENYLKIGQIRNHD
jgi:glycosyltransferase involved in cell wall biosynthesis